MGIAGSGPAAVTSQSGEAALVVNWCASAYDDICSEHTSWKFLRSRFSVNTVIGTEAYAITDCTDTKLSTPITSARFARWIIERRDTFRIYLTASGASTQASIWPKDYEWFRYQYQMQPPGNSQPIDFAIREDDNAILLGPKPNDIYTIVGEYYRTAAVLAADSDEPLFQSRFHMAIVWRAVRSYAIAEEDGGLYQAADGEYKRLHSSLMIDQLIRGRDAGPLA